jgi:hypothetical protein
MGQLRCPRSVYWPFVLSAARRCLRRHAGHVTERPRLGLPFARSAAVEVSYFYVRIGHAIPRREKWPITGAIQEDNLVARSIADLTRRPVGGGPSRRPMYFPRGISIMRSITRK